MGKLWHRIPGENGKAQLEEVALDGVKVTGPTLVYLSGFLTNNNRPDYVAGGIKRMEELLKDRNDPAQPLKIYAWSHTSLKNLFNLAAYNMAPSTRSSQAGYDIGRAVLMPLVAADVARDEKGNVTGTPLPLEEAKNNLRNVTLFGYSAGSIVAQETFNATLKMMKGIGYAEKDAREALREVVLVSVGAISRPSKETGRFNTLYLVASNDRIMRFKNWVWGTLGTAFRTAFGRYGWQKNARDLSIRPLSNSSVFISTAVKPDLHETQVDAENNAVNKKSFAPLYPKWTLRRSYHELPHYLTTDDNSNQFAKIALYTLANAVTRQGSANMLDLITPPKNDVFSVAAQAAYRARIDAALKPAPRKFG